MSTNRFFAQAASARSSLGALPEWADPNYSSKERTVADYLTNNSLEVVRELDRDPVTIETGNTNFITELKESIPTWAWWAGGLLGAGVVASLILGSRR